MNLDSLQGRRPWIVGGVAAAVLLVAVSWLLVIHPTLASSADTRSQADSTDFQNSQLLATNNKLAQSQRNIGVLRAKLAAALMALPASSALPEFTHELTSTAGATSVTLSSIGIGSLAPVTAAAAATAAPAASSSSASTATPAAAATPATAAQYSVGVTLTTKGTLGHQLAFVRALQNGSRRVLITTTSFTGLEPNLTLTTQLNIFTAPMSAGQTAQLRKLLTRS